MPIYKIMDGVSLESSKIVAEISSKGGTIISLKYDGRDVFYPQQVIDGKTRGGCHLCAPWFGISSFGSKKHGYLLDLECFDEEIHRHSTNMEFLHQHAEESYPWPMMYGVSAVLDKEEQSFLMSLVIQRLQLQGERTDPAPVLPGFHPYFKGDSKDVRIIMGKKEIAGPFNEKSRVVPVADDLVRIEVQGRVIEMRLGGAFLIRTEPQLILWSDRPEDYFCIKPVLYHKVLLEGGIGKFIEENEQMTLTMSLKFAR